MLLTDKQERALKTLENYHYLVDDLRRMLWHMGEHERNMVAVRLAENEPVEFEIGEGAKGPRAENVVKI